MAAFDQAARYPAKKLDSPGFLRWLLPGLPPDLPFLDWLDTHTIPFPDEPDRICDTVAGFRRPSDLEWFWALVLEFQTEPHGDMLDRLLEYVARLRRELRHGPERRGKYTVIPALLNLTGPPQPSTLDMELPGTAAKLSLGVELRTLREEDAAGTLARIATGEVARCILPWIPLMHGAGAAAIMEQWKQLAGAEPGSKMQADYAGLALVFAELAGIRVEWKRALEGWNVRQSQQVLEWQEEARREALAKGQLETKRATVLRAVQVRLQSPVPADLVARVEAMTSLEELDRWFDAALTAASLDDFRAAVRNGQ
jgi:hypothetical protein